MAGFQLTSATHSEHTGKDLLRSLCRLRQHTHVAAVQSLLQQASVPRLPCYEEAEVRVCTSCAAYLVSDLYKSWYSTERCVHAPCLCSNPQPGLCYQLCELIFCVQRRLASCLLQQPAIIRIRTLWQPLHEPRMLHNTSNAEALLGITPQHCAYEIACRLRSTTIWRKCEMTCLNCS